MAQILIGTAGGLVTPEADPALAGHNITALSLHDGITWALVDERRIWNDRDGWTEIAELPEDVDGASILARDGEVLVGTEGAHLYRLTDGTPAIVGSFEDVAERGKWYTPWGGPPAIRSMTAPDGDLFCNVHVGGILRSSGKKDWQQTIDIDTDVHQVIHDAVGTLFAPLGVQGVAASRDRGDAWNVSTEGLHGTYVRAAAVAGDALIVAASTGPFTTHAAVYRRARAGDRPFERCATGLPDRFGANIDTHWLGSDGETVAFVDPDGTVYRSADEGKTWEVVAEKVGEPRCLLVR